MINSVVRGLGIWIFRAAERQNYGTFASFAIFNAKLQAIYIDLGIFVNNITVGQLLSLNINLIQLEQPWCRAGDYYDADLQQQYRTQQPDL